jgi:hypothetical protein
MKHSVELLRDSKGIYGIGVAKDTEIDHPPSNIILRPDRLHEGGVNGTIFQMITGGFRHGMFSRTSEEQLRQAIHHEMLCRAGLPWPFPESHGLNGEFWWSTNKEQQNRNRQIYHGLRLGSLSIMNNMIGKALEEAAVPEAAKQARRFKFRYRQKIYEMGATSLRALQLIETFPALALALYARDPLHERTALAVALVERGAPLKKVAGLIGVPMALRMVKPGAAGLALGAIKKCEIDERLFYAHMPGTLPRMKSWLRAVRYASTIGPEFVEWVAKHALEIAETASDILSFLEDMADWVRACQLANTPRQIDREDLVFLDPGFDRLGPHSADYVTRRFTSDMSLRTVIRLNGEWHEAVANNMDGPSYRFPDPWCDAAIVGDYQILPITDNADLYREGHAMHHCVSTYGPRILHGEAYIYSLRKDNERIATVELTRQGDGASLGQLRGPCNRQVTREIERVATKWLRSHSKFSFPEVPVDPFQTAFLADRPNGGNANIFVGEEPPF